MWPLLGVLTLASVLTLPASTRRFLFRFAAGAIPLLAFIHAIVGPTTSTVRIGPVGLEGSDFARGAREGARLVGVFALFALGGRWLPARELLPYLTRPNLVSYIAGSLVRLGPTLRSDAEQLREAQMVRGHVFRKGPRAAASWVPLLVPLFVATLRRARDQALALHLSGLAPDRADPRGAGRRAHEIALVAALASLAIAGRLLLVAIPGVSFSFFFLFIAGVAYGPRVGLLVGVVERVATDFLITGSYPIWIPMAVVDGALGFGAGVLGQWVNFGQRSREPWTYATILAGTAGWSMTVAFSVAADTATWLFFGFAMPALDPSAAETVWTLLVVRGLVFNIPSMVFNAALFATATYPVLRGLSTSGSLPRMARTVHAHA